LEGAIMDGMQFTKYAADIREILEKDNICKSTD
jgi:hypothetical protein